jgi:hypothetical protein
MPDFEATLQQIVAPRLQTRGYKYESALQDGDVLFGFQKDLGDAVRALIQFQRHRRAAQAIGGEFTVNLLRVKAFDLQPRTFGGYPGALGARLSHVLWYVYDLQLYPQSIYWWPAATSEELAASLNEVVDQLLEYGLPWLEDPHGKRPWEMPTHRGREFREALYEIVAPELQQSGYRAETRYLTDDYPYSYFVKVLPEGLHAFVEFQQTYSLDPEHFEFDVRLQRKQPSDPFEFGGDFRYWLKTSLGQLLWQRQGDPGIEFDPFELAQAMLWQYADRAELHDRLRDALDKVKRYAIPWLEDPASRSSVIQ